MVMDRRRSLAYMLARMTKGDPREASIRMLKKKRKVIDDTFPPEPKLNVQDAPIVRINPSPYAG